MAGLVQTFVDYIKKMGDYSLGVGKYLKPRVPRAMPMSVTYEG